jgi:DnaJ-class molecular chaperone
MDYYQVLGVAYDDPPAKIRARFRLLAATVHPDVVGEGQEEDFARYVQAYHMLGNEERRQRYNKQLGIFVKPRPFHPGHDLYQRITIAPTLASKGNLVSLAFIRYDPCSRCWLTGCNHCEQSGMVPEQVCIEVKILPGTQHGSTIFIEGEGGRSEPGGTPGNLFVYVSVQSPEN